MVIGSRKDVLILVLLVSECLVYFKGKIDYILKFLCFFWLAPMVVCLFVEVGKNHAVVRL